MSLGFIHEITGRCNLACAFCYNPWSDGGEPPRELAPEENAALLERILEDSGATWITFTGGEPLLYEGLERVMLRLRRRFPALRLGLATNGILLASRLDGLLAAGLGYVEVSLFAGEAETYRRLAGSDSHDRPPHALALARARGLATTAATVLRRGMDGELEAIIRLAWVLGADRMALNRFAPRGRGARHREELQPSLEELDRMLSKADRLARELAFPIAVTTPVEACRLPHGRYPRLDFGACVCGDLKWAIDPSGRLRICELDDRPLGDLRQVTFSAAAEDSRMVALQKPDPRCASCTSWAACGGGCRFL